MTTHPILQLIRFHKPIGTLLLWFPTAWALWLAKLHAPDIKIFCYFLFGTFLMRSAGCILNDIADRHLDLHVKRTAKRPLTSGVISLPRALIYLMLILIAAFFILLQLPKTCYYYALVALFLTTLYPFTKRFFHSPQLILGLTFSMGIPMAFAALDTEPNQTLILLMIINFFWILAYDTTYALGDKVDDIKIGIKSTAVTWGRFSKPLIIICHTLAHTLWLWIAYIHQLHIQFYLYWTVGLMIILQQCYQLTHTSNDGDYMKLFTAHAYYGFVMWLGIITTEYY